MNRIALFFVACALGGAGGALGSIVGHAFGRSGLWVGGVLGGLVASLLVARIAVWRHWIARSQFRLTALGAAVGFLAACSVAVNTLSSPIGPVMSTVLIGGGAVLGSMLARSSGDLPDHTA